MGAETELTGHIAGWLNAYAPIPLRLHPKTLPIIDPG
jgi:hypothetical protein